MTWDKNILIVFRIFIVLVAEQDDSASWTLGRRQYDTPIKKNKQKNNIWINSPSKC